MFEEFTDTSRRLRNASRAFGGIFEIDAKRTEKDQLDRQSSREDLWQDPNRAQELMRHRSTLQEAIEGWESLQKRLEEQALMLDLAEAEEELSVTEEIAAALTTLTRDVSPAEQDHHTVSGPDDREKRHSDHPCGGRRSTESQDSARMLLRMYLRWTRPKRISDADPRYSGRRGSRHEERYHAHRRKIRLWVC